MKWLNLWMAFFLFMGIVCEADSMEDSFDPEKVAKNETTVWKAYYARDVEKATKPLTLMLEQVYGMPLRTEQVLPLYLKAVVAFATTPTATPPKQYNDEILPLLVTALAEIKKTSSYSFDPYTLAEKELSWWVARRIPAEQSTDKVGALMAEAYALLYGGKSEAYGRATFLRASAARYRDKCQDEFGGVREEDWKIVETMLADSYTNLKIVLQKKPEMSN